MTLNEILSAIYDYTEKEFMDEVMVDRPSTDEWFLTIPMDGHLDIHIRLADNSVFLYDAIQDLDRDFPDIRSALDYMKKRYAL